MSETIFAPTITDDMIKLHEDYFVPAIYAQWAHHVTELSEIELGQSILDVACRDQRNAQGLQTPRLGQHCGDGPTPPLQSI